MVTYYVACKHQPMIPTVNDSMPSLVFTNKAVFTSFKLACTENQAHRLLLTTIN
jgi:hypothetical protein